jgi:general nucleoside transport system permease protein
MSKISNRWVNIGFMLLAIVVALLFASIVLLIAQAQPLTAFYNMIIGSVGSVGKVADTLIAFVPLLLATVGLLITFTTGLWNIGVEGQIIIGAIFTTFVFRELQDTATPAWLIFILGFLAGALGGALWAAIVGALKTYGGVNEIFGGLGMNFVATAVTIWLIFGPWKRPGIASMSGTQPFVDRVWLPTFHGFRLSPWPLVVAAIAIVVVYLLLRGTYFGLRLKAVGKNGRAAFLLGIPTNTYMMLSFVLCGVFAGLAGAVQVESVYHRLIPSISSGYGFLGLLVAMLVNMDPLLVIPIAFFYAALNIGSIQLPLVMQLDSTFAGVLQGSLVLFVLIMDGVRKKYFLKKG